MAVDGKSAAAIMAALKHEKPAPELPSLEVTPAQMKAQQVREERKTRVPSQGDWASKYKMFEDWAEEEAYLEKLRQSEEKAKAEQQRKQIGGCSHDHSAERKLMEMSVDDKIRECAAFRLVGNAWFEEGQFFRAAEQYRKVTVWLDYTFPNTEEQEQKVQEVHLPALVNLAICRLRMKDYRGVIESARHALEIDPDNVKALFCMAKAYRCTTDFEKALQFLDKATKLDPEQIDLRKEHAFLRNSIQTYKQDTRNRARAMFGSEESREIEGAQTRQLEKSNLHSISQAEEQHPLLLVQGQNDDMLFESDFANYDDNDDVEYCSDSGSEQEYM